MNKTLLVFLLVGLSLGWQIQRRQMFGDDLKTNLKQEQYWFSQIIDHYNYQSSATWQQRYFVYNTYFDPSVGPVILYICGEAECRGISDQSYTARIAQETKGLVLSLEHRYYGKSLPFGSDSLSLQNLKFLTAEQALRDLGYFLVQMSKNKQYRITEKTPWITIGGSYPGAMAAWFRNKFPHLTIGSIASSGVVLAVEDFKMFDEQIYLSANKSGSQCTDAIVAISNYVEKQVTGDNEKSFKAQYQASELTAKEFLFYFIDMIVMQVQYGKRVQFCNSLKGLSFEKQYQVVKDIALKVTPADYGAFYLKNATWAIADGRGARSWIYQSCTQFSYFQTFSDIHPMRSKLLSIDFYRQWCNDIFGSNTWPYVSRVNTQFGGLNLNTNNLIMTNGAEDPWQWASVQKSKKSDIYAHVITCDDCAHCVDLHAPSQNDAKDLTDTRAYEMSTVKKWISEHWRQLNK